MELSMRFRQYADAGLEVFKANPVPSIVAGALMAVPILNCIVIVNFMAQVKASRLEGKPMQIGALLDFENAADKVIVPLLIALGSVVASAVVVGGLVVCTVFLFAPCLLADKPGLSWSRALQGSLSFAIKNPLDMLVLTLAVGLIAFVGSLCCVGFLVTGPVSAAMTYAAYEANKAGVETSSAERGVQL